jgi:hypothetical protein
MALRARWPLRCDDGEQNRVRSFHVAPLRHVVFIPRHVVFGQNSRPTAQRYLAFRLQSLGHRVDDGVSGRAIVFTHTSLALDFTNSTIRFGRIGNRQEMTTPATIVRRAKHALMACLFAMTMLAVSAGLGQHASASGSPSAGITTQQVSASHGSPSTPHPYCPLSSPAQSSGNCSSASPVGVGALTAGQPTHAAPRSSRLTVAAAAARVKIHGSRLERPPRF